MASTGLEPPEESPVPPPEHEPLVDDKLGCCELPHVDHDTLAPPQRQPPSGASGGDNKQRRGLAPGGGKRWTLEEEKTLRSLVSTLGAGQHARS